MLGWLVYEHGIEPHVTVFDKSGRQDGRQKAVHAALQSITAGLFQRNRP
jgi:hypothetical protein